MSFAQSLAVLGPLDGNPVSITNSSTSAQDLGANTIRVWMKTTTKTHIKFGESAMGAADTNDLYLTADLDYVFDVSVGTRYFRAIRSSADGTLYWGIVA